MTTITDTSVLHWLPFDDIGADPWKLAFIDAENQNWNSTDLNNGTTTLEKMAASKHGDNFTFLGSPAQLGLATGLLLSLLINSRIWTAKANGEGFGIKLLGTPKQYQWILHLTPSSSFLFASTKTFILHYLYLLPLFAFVLLLPLLLLFLVILLPFVLYRFAVFAYLVYRERIQETKRKLLSGADAVWTFNESHESYSVINALLLLEGRPDILQLREIFRNRFGAFPKLRMRRDCTLGYTTWYEDVDLDLGRLVRWLPGKWAGDTEEESDDKCRNLRGSTIGNPGNAPYEVNDHDLECGKQSKHVAKENSQCGKWNSRNLSKIIEELCNLPLPDCHSASWEARVGRAMMWEDDCPNEEAKNARTGIRPEIEKSETPTVFPILFRVHHSIGDGASLLQLMMSTLIDNEPATKENRGQGTEATFKRTPLSRSPTSKSNPKVSDVENRNDYLEKAELENQNAPPKSESEEGEVYLPRTHVTLSKITETNPKVQLNSHNEEKESSYLYGRRLSGNKIILWDSKSVTVEDVKKIRAATGVKFTEILLSAVSASLARYWEFSRSKNDLDNNNSLSENKGTGQQGEGHKKGDIQSGEIREKLKGENGQTTEASDCKKGEKPPSSVKLVIPAILGSLFQKSKCIDSNGNKDLENLFSVAVMSLPIGESGGCPLKRLAKVSDASGCMMPLKKESIIDYKSKSSNDVFSKKPDKTDSLSPTGVSKEARASSTTKQKGVQFSSEVKSMENENMNSKIVSDRSDKSAIINPHGAEVLTYYYTTKKSDSVLKLDPPVSSTSKEVSTVLYHKKADSAKLIIHNKEPYRCPTTIFFTHKNQNSIKSHSYKDTKCFLQTQEMSEKDERVEDQQGEDSCFINFSNQKQSEIVNFENKEDFASNADKKGLSDIAVANQDTPTPETPPPPSSLHLPSSPTIQHLITRWLALDIVATVIPSFIAAPLMSLASKGVAVVMSNLPGPTKKLHSVLGGHPMREIVFWAPHRGYTGVGITVISYDGKLEIGLMADEAVVPTRSGAQFILNAVLDELHSLGAAVSTSH